MHACVCMCVMERVEGEVDERHLRPADSVSGCKGAPRVAVVRDKIERIVDQDRDEWLPEAASGGGGGGGVILIERIVDHDRW